MNTNSVHHKKTGKYLHDIILGGQDGLVNVLGVILGVAAASGGDTRLIIATGLAATFAESISMAAVAYTSTLASKEFYEGEKRKEQWEIEHVPDEEEQEIRTIFSQKGIQGETLDTVVATIKGNKKAWIDIMMKDELGLTPVNRTDAIFSSVVVGGAAVAGSLVPLAPFLFVSATSGIPLSLVVSALVLFLVGFVKAKVTVGSPLKSGVQLLIIGILSALAGYFVAALVS